MIEIFVVINDGNHQYYLLKIKRNGFDIVCTPPHLGMHYTAHKSGESHFRPEEKTTKHRDELPVIMSDGEAGKPSARGIVRESLENLGRASCIFDAFYPINSLNNDFQKFSRGSKECFVIEKDLFPNEISFIQIGVWAVPARNEVSFEFNNPNIPADLLYKVARCEPQIWIYARPFT
jgi:hypothetical protein